MSVQPEVADALARLDRRERRVRHTTLATTALPLLIAGAALAYVTLQIGAAEGRHARAKAQLGQKLTELDATHTQLGAARAQLADFEHKKVEVVAQTEAVRKERELLTADKQQLIAELEELRAEKERLLGQTKLYESDRTAVRESLSKLAARQPSLVAGDLPITAVAAPKASATKVPGSDRNYTFRAWLDVPAPRRAQIASVTYLFDHPTMHNKELSSRRPDDGFAVQYVGWGALTNVVVEVRLKSGAREKMAFNMLAALGWN